MYSRYISYFYTSKKSTTIPKPEYVGHFWKGIPLLFTTIFVRKKSLALWELVAMTFALKPNMRLENPLCSIGIHRLKWWVLYSRRIAVLVFGGGIYFDQAIQNHPTCEKLFGPSTLTQKTFSKAVGFWGELCPFTIANQKISRTLLRLILVTVEKTIVFKHLFLFYFQSFGACWHNSPNIVGTPCQK